ncbi:hypothetical protein C7S14_1091 [Burkholderia cepacia]|nr:hypothetical protein C7S14_1091 [Burkholderia cepacia]
MIVFLSYGCGEVTVAAEVVVASAISGGCRPNAAGRRKERTRVTPDFESASGRQG